ncbi:MAG: hypothetical protein A2Z21_05475 [Candidatus Fraserbacteria bacterium RBG_16_55_9]|uniref:Uncharacterized protein n=1 Tax=Fraserbacteria sp. (strain RBG_16_55_9) TaxID=1817864 RepID=A0A1F5V2S9_FRAXR|nr:MAG: hypothetical protein A2Z21_05475 [Candidatus Fraserbacteria bacterium RBG_16_55_9]
MIWVQSIMTSKKFPVSLLEEVRQNLERLRRDLTVLNTPNSEDASFAEGYCFQAYETLNAKTLQRMDRGVVEMLRAFYKSLRMLSEGHSGFVTADEEMLGRAYRITLEAAIEMGEELLEG